MTKIYHHWKPIGKEKQRKSLKKFVPVLKHLYVLKLRVNSHWAKANVKAWMFCEVCRLLAQDATLYFKEPFASSAVFAFFRFTSRSLSVRCKRTPRNKVYLHFTLVFHEDHSFSKSPTLTIIIHSFCLCTGRFTIYRSCATRKIYICATQQCADLKYSCVRRLARVQEIIRRLVQV